MGRRKKSVYTPDLPVIQWDWHINRSGNPDVTTIAKTLNALRTYLNNETLEGYVTQETLAEDTGQALTTVKEQLRAARWLGLIEVYSKGHSACKANDYRGRFVGAERLAAFRIKDVPKGKVGGVRGRRSAPEGGDGSPYYRATGRPPTTPTTTPVLENGTRPDEAAEDAAGLGASGGDVPFNAEATTPSNRATQRPIENGLPAEMLELMYLAGSNGGYVSLDGTDTKAQAIVDACRKDKAVGKLYQHGMKVAEAEGYGRIDWGKELVLTDAGREFLAELQAGDAD